MSATLASAITVTGNFLVQGQYTNVNSLNSTYLQGPILNMTSVGGFTGAVACGQSHTAIVLANGTVQAFGNNNNGQLGVNDQVNRSTPVQVWNISSSAIAVACGYYHTAVLLANGTVQAFGKNNVGQLGVNDTVTRSTPVQVLNISTAIAVACGYYHTAVVLANGTVRTFGNNVAGQLGVNDTVTRSTPVPVWAISSSAIAVACGKYHTAVLLANGTVQTFGRNAFNQLGVNDTANRSTPVQVWAISSSAIAVACGQNHTAVLLANGTVQTFGSNTYGQLGVNDQVIRSTPVQVFAISSSAIAVACGTTITAIVLANGTVQTFGNNNAGQLGVNDTANRSTPVQVWAISSSAIAVAGGYYHTAVLLANGTVQAFGRNTNGQLGLNDTASRSTPVQVLNISTAGGITYQSPALLLGLSAYSSYNVDLSTDYARKATTSTWYTGSDERIKTNIESANVARCVDIVQNLDLKYFEWDFPEGTDADDKHSLGWIAQEFAQFFPKSVDTNEAHGISDFQNLNSDQIIKVMWGALRQLRAQLKSQTAT